MAKTKKKKTTHPVIFWLKTAHWKQFKEQARRAKTTCAGLFRQKMGFKDIVGPTPADKPKRRATKRPATKTKARPRVKPTAKAKAATSS